MWRFSPQSKAFCQKVGRRQKMSLAFCKFLARRIWMCSHKFTHQNRDILWHIMQKIYLHYLLAQGVDGARQFYNQQLFARAGAFANVALQSNSLLACELAKMFFRKVETHVFHALLGRSSQLTPAEAVVVLTNFHSQNMILLGAFAQLLGHVVPHGFPTPIEITLRVPLQRRHHISCFVHGLFLIRNGNLKEGILLLDHLDLLYPGKFPEAVMATVRASIDRSFAGLGHSECSLRLESLIAQGFTPAEELYATRFLGSASGVKNITLELKTIGKLSPSTRSRCVKKSLLKRLYATTSRQRGENRRLRLRAQKARTEAIRLQQLCQSAPSDKTREKAQKAEELASELERKADAAADEVEQNNRLVLEANEAIKEAKAAATLRAKEDAKAARARAKVLRDEAKRAEKQAQDEAKQAEKRARDEAKQAEKLAKRAKPASQVESHLGV